MEILSTQLEEKEIYNFLELLRKKGLKIYVSNWASNNKNIFIISNKSHRGFDIVVDDDSTISKRGLKLVSNGAFLDQAIKLY